MRNLEDKTPSSAECSELLSGNPAWQRATTYWRWFPAEAFDAEVQDEVRLSIGSIFSTIDPWCRAIDGDPAAAVALALSFDVPQTIGVKTDLAMTVLLRCAFENAGAALVLSNRLSLMPLHRTDRARLATSWLVHNLWLAHRRADARRSVCMSASIDGARK